MQETVKLLLTSFDILYVLQLCGVELFGAWFLCKTVALQSNTVLIGKTYLIIQ